MAFPATQAADRRPLSSEHADFGQQVDDGGGCVGARSEDHRVAGLLRRRLQRHQPLSSTFAAGSIVETTTFFDARRPFIVGYRGRLMPSLTPTTAGAGSSNTTRPASVSRSTRTTASTIDSALAPLTTGRPRARADADADLEAPGIGGLVAEQHEVERRCRFAARRSPRRWPLRCAAGPNPTVRVHQHRLVDADAGGVTQLFLGLRRPDGQHRRSTAVLFDELHRRLDRTSSCGLVVKPRNDVSTARPSAVTLIRVPGAGTRFTHTNTFIDAPFRLALHPRVVGVEQRLAADA